MAWFEKKWREHEEDIPSLPELPELPELPKMDNSPRMSQLDLPHLPSYPNSSFGKKFSQNAIKDAVSGEKEEEGEADEFPGEKEMMPRPPQINYPKRMSMPSEEYPKFSRTMKPGKAEPVFIRIDKFEESLNMLTDARKKLGEMEEMLRSIKKIKEEEDKELKEWETEIQAIKEEFEKVNQDLFSRI